MEQSALAEPYSGFYADKSKGTRWGRHLPWIAISFIPWLIVSYFIWIPPQELITKSDQ